MSAMASQIFGVSIVYSTVCSGADQRKHQSSVSLAFVWRIHRQLVNSPQKEPATRKMFPFDDVIMCIYQNIKTNFADDRETSGIIEYNNFLVRWIFRPYYLTILCICTRIVWYDMIWYDMIWYDLMSCDVMWCDMVWCGVMWCDVIYDMIWYDMIWYDMIWYDMIWYDMIWYDMIWYDMTRCDVMWCDVVWCDAIKWKYWNTYTCISKQSAPVLWLKKKRPFSAIIVLCDVMWYDIWYDIWYDRIYDIFDIWYDRVG